MPQPSPGQKPLDDRSYTRISPVASAPVLAKPTISKGSIDRSTPPATATSTSDSSSDRQALMTDSSDDEQAPSTVYPPPRRSKWLQIRPAIVFDSAPARVSSSTGGNGALNVRSSSATNSATSG